MEQLRDKIGRFASAGDTSGDSADGVKVVGIDVISRTLKQLIKHVPEDVARALYEEAQIEREESMRRTPVDTGALRASHEVSRPVIDGDTISVTISVGGPAAPYAVHVHENMDAFHPVGQAKFLESTILQSKPYLAARVARRVALNKLIG